MDFSDDRGNLRQTHAFGRGAFTHHQNRPSRGRRVGNADDRIDSNQNFDIGSHSSEPRNNPTPDVPNRQNFCNVRPLGHHSRVFRDSKRRDSALKCQASEHLGQTSRSSWDCSSVNPHDVDFRKDSRQGEATSGNPEMRSRRRGSSEYHQRNHHQVHFRIKSPENQASGQPERTFPGRNASEPYQRYQHESDHRVRSSPSQRLWTTEQTLEENHLLDERTDLSEEGFEGLSAPSKREIGEICNGARSYASESQNSIAGEYVNELEAEQLLSSTPSNHPNGARRPCEKRPENSMQGRSFVQGRKVRDLKTNALHAEKRVVIHEKKNWQRRLTIVPCKELESNPKHEKPSIPQLVQELEEKILGGKVECMICCEIVGRTAATWSCVSCYSMFHLTCIRKWAQAPSSVYMASSSASQSNCDGNWRCPGCQSVQTVGARELRYECFCGKLGEPPVDYYLTPHSCGEPCQKPLDKSKLGKCKHLCTLQCHPGPCPPCAAFAPPQSCSCGKTNFARRCADQGKGPNICGQPCGRRLQCGRHSCSRTCHEDSCDACEVMLTATCFCGKMAENLSCGQLDVQGELDFEHGVYSCGGTCGKKLSCKNHNCAQKCHPGPCAGCELSPSNILTCPCGKHLLKDLPGRDVTRVSCLDPVSTCGQGCSKLLPCKKHQCQSACHVGPCSPCMVSTEQKCRCGSTSRTVPCHVSLLSEQAAAGRNGLLQDDKVLFLCERKCDKKKSCGRHRCSNRCCFLSLPDRQGSIIDSGASSEHLCLLTCGKKLRCGNHSCQNLCHSGHCPPCLESTFTELSCACGRTSILPPVACGTPLPSCEYPCSISQPCSHPVTHSCHFGDCPPCSVPVAKECVGNHVTVRNVPCGSREIKCNKLCGKPRQCGLHACARTCHLPPCDFQAEEISDNIGRHKPSCGQLCGAPRRDCSHTCAAPCHPASPCPEDWCKTLVTITCSCGRRSAEVPCAAGGPVDAEVETKILLRLAAPLQPLETREKVPLGQRKLVCDDDCAKAEKKRMLANAFGMDESRSGEDPRTVEGSVAGAEILQLAKKDPQFVAAVEDRFRFLLLGPKRPAGQGTLRLHVFCGLPLENRELIRQLAERWCLSVNAVGRDPRRCSIVHATPKSKLPTKSMVSKGSISGQSVPNFNPAIDMHPGLVVGLFDLPRDADVSTLVLRFGGECELVWLNDKNALAVFSDEARAATALRRVDHASTYYGAVSMPAKGPVCRIGWAAGANPSKTSFTKKKLQESSWVEDAWSEDGKTAVEYSAGIWQSKAVSINPSNNPWGALKHVQGTGESSQVRSSVLPQLVMSSSRPSAVIQDPPLVLGKISSQGVEYEDWENAFD